MAEIERTEHGDSGRARAWTLRAVRALHDPVWTADGYVSDRWRPVSPVSGRLDAFQWQTPLAALPSDQRRRDRIRRPWRRRCWRRRAASSRRANLPPRCDRRSRAAQDNSPALAPAAEPAAPADPSRSQRRHRRRQPNPRRSAAAPLFRARQDIPKNVPASIPQVIPILRAPDDPGIDDEAAGDEFAEQISPAPGPGRRLARVSGPLGQLISRALRRPAFFLPNRALPDIRCQRFQAVVRARRLVRRNSSVGRARHS